MRSEPGEQMTDLVLVHGWSMHSGVWQPLLDRLTQTYRLHLLDLPGHGLSEWHDDDFELDILLARWQQSTPDNAVWLGWSLGGLLSIAMAARFPQKVGKLILLAATPCFVQKQDWSTAMSAAIFEAFAASLALDQQQTLQRFLMLQAKGAEHGRETLRQLAEQLSRQHPPQRDALKAGLEVLQILDQRESLSALDCPVQMILAGHDNLVPVSLAQTAIELNPAIQVDVIEQAGHAPLISHPQHCQQLIELFIHG